MKRTVTVVLAAAVCSLIAGCATHASVPPSRYLVCQNIAGICVGTTPRHEPAALYLSADGSVWARDIKWAGWGTATASGAGTAEVNDCTPDCAAGTFSAHPVTITLTRPVSWHGSVVYSRAVFSVPAIHDHQVITAGLIPSPVQDSQSLP